MRLFSKTLVAFSLALLTAAGARADDCRSVGVPISTSYFLAGCTSPFGLCTAGTIPSGPLAGTTRFTVLTLTPGPSATDLRYTGELVITTVHGTLTLRDIGVIDQATGQYFELEQVVSGTGSFAHASGLLTSSGYGTSTGFFGTLSGAVCGAGRGDDRGDTASHGEGPDHRDGGSRSE